MRGPARRLRRAALSAARLLPRRRAREPGAGLEAPSGTARALRVLAVDSFRAAMLQPALFGELAGRFLELFAPVRSC
ncbi:MAG: hypothetical protein U1F11_02995 [Steroidobacteraceae bacterium]